MTTAALITKLKKLDKRKDKHVLEAIEILLRDDSKEARIRSRLLEGAIRSEDDIDNGRVMTIAEAKRKMSAHLAARRRSRDREKGTKRA
ncbi:MAG: hypothetical protein R2811_11685 [Flavobacteriales bacterium]